MRGDATAWRGRALCALALVLLLPAVPRGYTALGAQAAGSAATTEQRIRQQRDQLEAIRREREQLEREAARLRTTVTDLSAEVTNLSRRADATARLVRALEGQLATISAEVDAATANMQRAERELADKRGTLRRRVVDVYKRGPMHTTEALLSARSFGDLVARYKYLHLLTQRDRALVRRVEQLRNQISYERDRLVTLRAQLQESRRDKEREEERLRTLRRDAAGSLTRVQQEARRVEARLAERRRTEAQVNNMIASLEAERRRAAAARPSAATRSTVTTADLGRLDWPVDGPLVYQFGRAQTASNTTIRWNGIGIEARQGTPVRSVAAGTVARVGQLGTYGLTIILDHGGGDYSVYGSLARSDVREGQAVTKGQAIGTVGAADPDLPPHLHFEVRQGGPAVDPTTWLRSRR
jgi:murein hydrolase activator